MNLDLYAHKLEEHFFFAYRWTHQPFTVLPFLLEEGWTNLSSASSALPREEFLKRGMKELVTQTCPRLTFSFCSVSVSLFGNFLVPLENAAEFQLEMDQPGSKILGPELVIAKTVRDPRHSFSLIGLNWDISSLLINPSALVQPMLLKH